MSNGGYREGMTDPADKLTPMDPRIIAAIAEARTSLDAKEANRRHA
jgi:hypothetical protein